MLTTHNLALGYGADRVLTLEDGRVVRSETGRRGNTAAEDR